MKRLELAGIFLLCMNFALNTQAQIRTCGMDAVMDQLLEDPAYRQAHERKLARVAELAENRLEVRAECEDKIVYPVAIHFQGISNPDAACLAALTEDQMTILNNDYQGLNEDISEWNDDASSFFPDISNGESCIAFCLATKNHPPGYGLVDGDLAITINQTSGSFSADWSGYINIFVRNIGALGFSPLGGDGNGDGVTIDVTAFGSGAGCGQVNPGAPYHLGRTLSHEMGHYFLLYHIWRSNGCGLDDLVDDTPLQDDEYFGCPALGVSSCGSNDMHMNYMDYVNDACMYMFSAGQATRMEDYGLDFLSNVSSNESVVCDSETGGPTCDDGVQNGDETGVDCGGSTCPACPTCDDGIQNGDETGVDCGGSCPPCTSCDDGIQNGDETGVDCGGSTCPACPTCDDGIQNGEETGVDCGGPCVSCVSICEDNPVTLDLVLDANGSQTTWEITDDEGMTVASGGPYSDGQNGQNIEHSFCLSDGCYTFTIFDSGNNGICCRAGFGSYNLINDVTAEILASGAFFVSSQSTDFCLDGAGQMPTCNDGIQNGDETGIDCGGSCQACTTCNDDLQNGDETGIDCGGSCPACTSCDDGVQNGDETGVDCGGSCPACTSCNDGIQNGNETGVDCGGACPPCQNGECGPPTGNYVEFLNISTWVIVHWDIVADATLYEIQYRKQGDTAWRNRFSNTNQITLMRLLTGTTYEYKLRAQCPEGWTGFSLIATFTTNSSRGEKKPDEGFILENIYPNPVSRTAYISYFTEKAGNITIAVYDVLGRKVLAVEQGAAAGRNVLELNTLRLEKGYYLVRMQKEELQVSGSFIKGRF